MLEQLVIPNVQAEKRPTVLVSSWLLSMYEGVNAHGTRIYVVNKFELKEFTF